MPSRADVNVLVDANRAVRELIARDLNAYWRTLDLSDPSAARDALLRFMPSLVTRYGDVTATVAADWYSTMRVQSGASGRFRPILADNIAAEFVEQGTRTAAGALFTAEPEKTLAYLVATAGKWAAQTGRNTIIQSASRDSWKPRVARVPSGATTCAFCLMNASRGAVYTSLATAGKWNKYHGDCDCQVVVIGPQDEYPEGYDPGELYDQYRSARDQAGTNLAKGSGSEDDNSLSILQALRRDGEANVADAVDAHDH